MIWHGGFPLFVLGYALLKDRDGGARVQASTGTAILASIARRRRRDDRLHLARHRRARLAADAAERGTLHVP